MGFIVNLALEVYTFNIDIVLSRRVYDPGGKVLYWMETLNTTMTVLLLYSDRVGAHKNALSLSFEFCFHISFELQVSNNGIMTLCMVMISGDYNLVFTLDSSTSIAWLIIK